MKFNKKTTFIFLYFLIEFHFQIVLSKFIKMFCLGLSRIQLLQQSSSSSSSSSSSGGPGSITVEPIRLVDITDIHNVLRLIDARPGLKYVILDMRDSTALQMILAQVWVNFVALLHASILLGGSHMWNGSEMKKTILKCFRFVSELFQVYWHGEKICKSWNSFRILSYIIEVKLYFK